MKLNISIGLGEIVTLWCNYETYMSEIVKLDGFRAVGLQDYDSPTYKGVEIPQAAMMGKLCGIPVKLDNYVPDNTIQARQGNELLRIWEIVEDESE